MDLELRKLERKARNGNKRAQKRLDRMRRRSQRVIDRWELEASICRDSFYDFVQRFWSVVIPEEPVWNWHIKEICELLQDAAERVFRGEPKKHDIVINVPPGTSKSTICSVMFPAWIWTRMPSARSICTSYNYNLAMDLSRKSRDVVQSDKWIKLFGDIHLREDQNTKGYFANTEGGSRYCCGTDGTVTGFHGHFVIIDDPLDPQRAVSEAELKAANRWVTETLPTRKVSKANSVSILIMQRLHQSDPSAEFLSRASKGGAPVRHVNLPAEVQGNGRDVVRPRKWAKYYKDGLLDPVRLSRPVLRQMRAEMGEYGYSGQMLQHPVPLGGGMFRTSRVQVDQPPSKWVSRCRYWDKAGTADGGAYTVGLLMGLDRAGRYWVLDVVRGQWESAEREARILQTAQIDGTGVLIGIEQEPGSGGKESAQNTVKMLAGFSVRVDRPTGDKVIRADPFSVQVNAGNVSISPALWNLLYLEELEFFPYSKFKDQVDASSGAFSLLTQPRTRVGALRK